MNCEQCGRWFEPRETGRTRRYCDGACRQAAYRARKSGEAPVFYGTSDEVAEVLADARSVPGGSYPAAAGDQDPLGRELAELENAAPRYPSASGKALVSWLRTGDRHWFASKALVEDTAGSTFIPLDIAADIAAVARQAGTIRALASVRPAGGNKHRAGLLSAATTGWGRLETGTAVTDAAVSVSSPALDIDVHDVLALAQIGTDELDDSVEAARAAIVEAIGIAIGEAEDTAFSGGTGTGQPKGLTLAANVTRVPAGQKTTAAASATPVLADILGLPWKLPTRYRRNATWLMSEDMAPKIAALTYPTGSGIMPDAGTGRGPLGYPFYVVPGLPSAAAAGVTDPSVWFADVASAYRVADRGQLAVQRLTERYAELGLVGMLVKRRVGGDMVRPDACAVYLL